MITRQEFDLYRSEDFMSAVEDNILRDPADIAFDKRIPFARELASRVKYLQKARVKLPSFYASRCIIPPRAYEQSTSEAVAGEKDYSGGVCLDLTCGLGVDSYALSRNFEKVTALERDPLLAEVTRYNFGLLGADNIDVVNMPAEEYLGRNPGLKTDMVYADPDRRDSGGNRVAALEECSPDIRQLMPRLREVAPRVAVKLSPLFDIHEAQRIFGPGTTVTVISESGECKEVLVETDTCADGRFISARITGRGAVTLPYTGAGGAASAAAGPAIESFEYLAVPDVALVKSETAQEYYGSQGWYMTSGRGFAYGDEPLPDFGSRVFRIAAVEEYNPRKLKKLLREKGIGRLNFFMRDFPYGVKDVAGQLGVREGGNGFAALLTRNGKRIFVLLGDAPGPGVP